MFQDTSETLSQPLVLSGFEQEEKPKNYNVLSRKYRPQTFDDLLGQEVTITALVNAITAERMPHAIVLTGIQGVGKTTIARIIAQCLNCVTNAKASPNNCCKCSQCTSIAISQNQDVLEMDAASNTSVNDIREIIENSRYRPSIGRYRIYIIDEVHMLSNSAFNALLKTLEEPPSYVKFILATTEIRKIPITVLSRCQRFNLRRLNFDELESYYNTIITKEGYTADTEAISSIAKAANGSVRDGLSMLDQAIMITVPNKHINALAVRNMLGYGERVLLYDLLGLIAEGLVQESMEIIRSIYYNNSYDPYVMLNDMAEIVHELIISKSEAKISRPHESYDIEALSQLLPKFSMPFLLRAWQVLLAAIQDMRSFNQSLGILEITAMKLMCINVYETPESVVQILNKSFSQSGILNSKSDVSETKKSEANNSDNSSSNINSKHDFNINQNHSSDIVDLNLKLENAKPENELEQLNNHSIQPKELKTGLAQTEKSKPQPVFLVQDLLKLIAEYGDIILYNIIHGEVEIRAFDLNTKYIHIAILTTQDSSGIVRQIKEHMANVIPGEWRVKVDFVNSIDTINAIEIATAALQREKIANDSLVRSVLSSFPGSEIDKIS